uniref:Putative head tail connector protein n=1 Tax=viral metagenome TaxID=1070528 RepID=A0A6M3KFI7_9ZZZZ
MSKLLKEQIDQEIDRFRKKKKERSLFERQWQDICDLMIPERSGFISETSKGDKTTKKIYDGTAIDALNVCVAGISGMLTNAALPWNYVKMADNDLNMEEDIRAGLIQANEVLNNEINMSNFYVNIDETYLDGTGLGTGCIYIGQGSKTLLNYRARPLNEIFLDENEDGYVDTVWRCFKMSARLAKSKWGENNLPSAIKTALAANEVDKEFEIIHLVRPREKRDTDGNGNYKFDNLNMPYLSAYLYEGEKMLIDEGGYEEFPYAVARMRKLSGEVYGRGPGWNALPDVSMLNTMELTGIRSWQKASDPPVVVPDEGYSLPIKTGPGGVTYNSNWDKPGSDPKPLYPSNPNLPNFEKKCEQKREQIREFFYNKQFRTQQEGQPRTAQEIIQIASENLKILGPVLGRFQPELLKTVVERSFGICFRAGRFPILEQALMVRFGPNLRSENVLKLIKVIFVSPITKAQMLYEVQELQNAFSMILPTANIKPEILDRIDGDKVYDEVSELYPALQKVTVDEKKVKQIRDQREKQRVEQKTKEDAALLLAGAEQASKINPTEGLLGTLSGNVGT